MAILYSVVAIVGLVCALDLLLTIGVIRRLREHTRLLSRSVPDGPPPSVMLGANETVGTFSTSSTSGEPITQELFHDAPTLVGVFAQGCSSCEERLPDFVRYAKGLDSDREQVLSVVIGDPANGSLHVEDLQAIGRVVIEDRPGSPLSAALGVKGYPAFARVDTTGAVRSSGTLLEHALV